MTAARRRRRRLRRPRRPRGTNDTAGARRIAAAFAAAARDGRAALIPYVVAGYPDAETSLRVALAAADAGADLLEIGLPYSDPLADGATLQRASGVALEAGATFDGSIALIERIAAARPDLPLVPMAYANQVIGGGDGAARPGAWPRPAPAGVIVADLTPDEGGPVRGGRPGGRSRRRLPRRADHRARAAGADRRPDRRLPLLRVAGRRDRRAGGPAIDRRPARPRRPGGPVPVAVGFGVSRPAHVRALARAGADGVIVASALVDALGPDGRDVAGLSRLVRELRAATVR